MNGHVISHMGPRDALLVVLTACGFGSSFLFIKIVVPEVPPVTLTLARSGVALATLLLVLWLGGHRLPSPGRIWLHLFALGAMSQVVPMILLSWGQQHIASGLAGIILGCVPVVTMVLAHIFMHDERMSVRSLFGALVGFGGVVAVIGAGALGHHADGELLAELAVFGAATGIAAANVLARHAGRLPPVVLAASTQTAAVVLLAPLSLVLDAPWTLHPGADALGALVVLGVVGSAIPGLLFYRLLLRVGATRASLAAYLVPLVAVLLGALVLDERLAWSTLAGMVLILIGAVLVNRRIVAPAGGS